VCPICSVGSWALAGGATGLQLIGEDEQLRLAIRRELSGTGRADREDRHRARRRPAAALGKLADRRRKLLDLHHADKITPELFGEEEARILRAIEAAQAAAGEEEAQDDQDGTLAARFEEVAALLGELDVERFWEAATQAERRVLIEELVESVAFFPDHLEIVVAGVPKLNVLLSEVGLKEKSQTVGVGGGT